ncbi:MAG: T9SS type A sorting domain-containing protein [Bacteroidetes bacterium]|nr:T9SS type A sorting domain-containing protein [Bacteroidota bacterium]
MKKITLIAIAFLFAICFTLPVASFAQSGSLDLTFDNDGKVTTSFGSNTGLGHALAIQSDGKLVVAGFSINAIYNEFTLVRYNTSGSLDTSFDSDGKATTPIGISDARAESVVIQSDGKIVVAGYSTNSTNFFDIALVRYNTNGSLDTTFDTDGIVTTDVGPISDVGSAVTIQSDGKILVAGYIHLSTNTSVGLLRYNTNGSLDTTFDSDGIVATPIGTFHDDIGYSVGVQSDGKIVVAGVSFSGSNDDFALVRYDTNGSLDTSFDADGIVTTPIGTSLDVGYDLAFQSDGKIVVAGVSIIGSIQNFAVVRYNSNGSLDTTFNADGMVTTAIGTTQSAGFSVVIQSDGKIVVAGRTGNVFNSDVFALVRYNTNGSLDVSFDTDGIVTTPMGADAYGFSVALQSDDKIVVAGFSSIGNVGSFAVARYNNTISVGINETDNQTTDIKIYPNPFSSSTTLHTNYLLKNATLTVYNLYGQVVKQINKLSGQTIILQRDNLSSGLYFIHLTEDNKILTTDKLIITD